MGPRVYKNSLTFAGVICKPKHSNFGKRQTPSGHTVISFSIAIYDRRVKDKEKATSFFRCEAWGATAEHIDKWYQPGDCIMFDGRMKVQHREKDAKKETYHTAIIEEVHTIYEAKSEPTPEHDDPSPGDETTDEPPF